MSLLQDMKVIDLASFLAGPGAGTLMADHGAEVIKIEPPGGDGYRRLHGRHRTDYNWQLTSRHKKGLVLDIRKAEGMAVLERLLAGADVMLTNFREEQVGKFGLDYEKDLKEKFPRLIYARLTGYGSSGPERGRRGYDATAWWARSGIMQVMKNYDEPPVFPAAGVGDHASAMALFGGIMMALYRRERTGEGGLVETSLIANGCWANGMSLQGAISGFDVARVMEARRVQRSPFAKVYRTREQRHIILVLTNPAKEWFDLTKALGHPEWAEDERFPDLGAMMKRREELGEMIAGVINAMTLAELCPALDDYAITYGVVEGLTDVVTDAHLIESGVIVPTESEDPDFRWTVASPIKVSGETPVPIKDPPGLGEHTLSLLAELGYADNEIKGLLERQVVYAAGDPRPPSPRREGKAKEGR